METKLDLGRWREKPRGVAYRRWVIVSTGLRQLLRMRLFQILIFFAWTGGLLAAISGFVFTQSVASGGWFEQWAAEFGPRGQAVGSAFSALVLLYPDIVITGLFTVLFSAQAWLGLALSLVGLTIVVPRLITRDRASNALTIYLSRPLTSFDYLIGKFGIILGILLLVWTGPMLFAWLLSMAFAPSTDFIVYSFSPVVRALLFNAVGLAALGSLALWVSSVAKTAKTVIPLWIFMIVGLWVISGAPGTPEVIRSASVCRDLFIMHGEIFRFDELLKNASESLPFFNREISENLAKGAREFADRNATSAMMGLVGLVIVTSLAFARKVRPE